MSDNAKSVAANLEEAHVQFLLSRLREDGLIASIEREVGALYQWGEGVTLNQIVDREVLVKSVLRWVGEAPFNESLRDIVVQSVITGIQSELNDGTNLKSLVNKSQFDNAVSHLAQFEKLRMDIVHLVMESPLYSELITDVLYHGIKDYVMTENMVVKKVPGVSALMKAGAKQLNKAMPKLEAAAEGTIKKFIAGNLRNSVELSERVLNNALSENNIKTIGDHFWTTVSEKEFGQLKGYVSESDVQQTIEVGEKLWSDLRQAEYLQAMIEKIILHVLDEQGDKPLAQLVTEIGYDREYITEEVKQVLPSALGNDAVWKLLEQRVRSNLADFYGSETCQKALS